VKFLSPQFFRPHVSRFTIYTSRHTLPAQYAISSLRGGTNHPGTQLYKLRWNEWTVTRSRRTDPQEFWLDLGSGLIKPAKPLPSRCGLPG
jgi:hypothetical protein